MPMLKLEPSFKDYIWGGNKLITKFNKNYQGERLAESWELSVHPDGLSVVAGGAGKSLREYLERAGEKALGKNCERFNEFPVLIKLIDAKQDLSVQVHPDDAYALKNENQYGKSEMWYVVECEPDSYLYYGFAKSISPGEFCERIESGTLMEVLNKVPAEKGGVFFIEAGTIHTIGAGVLLVEIQQNSNVTYRVYDYGRTDKDGNQRELHVEKALDVTDTGPAASKSAVPHLAKCEHFTVDKLYLDGRIVRELRGEVNELSFLSIVVLEGGGGIRCAGESMEFKKGDSFFITAGSGEYTITGTCEALATYVG
ncbi:MAG: class I mannose-6-phosphate isomerase [Synergistaceae bacterium]|nr:class I mannose-6-phosphate isomerase [Synergistaceae bacterium]